MDFKSYDLVVKYTTCSGKRVEKKWESIEKFYNDMNTSDVEKLLEIPMLDESDVEAVIFGHTGDIKRFKTVAELVKFIEKKLLGK